MRKSVEAIADDLTEDGFVRRYRTDETDDGLSGKEGSFLICSFWLVSALATIGEVQRARDLMERLLEFASPLDLYAEQFDTTPADTSATSHKRSPIWRSLGLPDGSSSPSGLRNTHRERLGARGR
jgi:GH15 family glucan-1,4-alpha-glucosidase